MSVPSLPSSSSYSALHFFYPSNVWLGIFYINIHTLKPLYLASESNKIESQGLTSIQFHSSGLFLGQGAQFKVEDWTCSFNKFFFQMKDRSNWMREEKTTEARI